MSGLLVPVEFALYCGHVDDVSVGVGRSYQQAVQQVAGSFLSSGQEQVTALRQLAVYPKF